MAKIFLFFPFKNYSEDDVLKEDVEDLRKSGLKFEVIVWQRPPVTLRDVGDDDLLIIAGHGDLGDGTLAMNGKAGDVAITASELAEMLETGGLAKSHQSILLITCFGGGSSKMKNPTGAARVPAADLIVKNNKKGECLASILGKALGMRRYFSILVGGWPGSFISSDPDFGTRSSFEARDNEYVLAQLDHIQWFDCKGSNTVSAPA
ncbi:hypothetical protein [Methylococcus sp. EFPC2]|uniref:hypothetical protein n=1 Tax=Methylococcus sp. EFPC2 TaxID=2812648 RepID=UPI001967479F|nr:hypothetical protein [Methylococcus sp. EFPC2]QSA96602.1 hypothetical protein JWZ97_15480 [Methylococcus sp. EFPC2]